MYYIINVKGIPFRQGAGLGSFTLREFVSHFLKNINNILNVFVSESGRNHRQNPALFYKNNLFIGKKG